MTYCQFIIKTLRIISVRCIPLRLRSKTRRRETLLLRYLISYLIFDIRMKGQMRTSLYDKRDDLNFHITIFPFMSSKIPSSQAYGVFISQLMQYARACTSYEYFILRAARLSYKLIWQKYAMEHLKPSLRKLYGRYGISSNNMKFPSPKSDPLFLSMTIYSDTLDWSYISLTQDPVTEVDLITDFDLLNKFREVSIEHLQWCG